MSTYNIREKFSYVIATSSIDYIRNYNFNTSTVTDIPITMINSDEEIPITVNITTEKPWMQIVDPVSGKDLKYPNGNVILDPTSSAVVLLKIDLPPEIESEPKTVIYPNISLDIKSGSFPVILPTSVVGSTTTRTASLEEIANSIIPEQKEYVLDIGEKIKVNLALYDASGSLDTTSRVLWRVETSQEPQDIEKIIRTDNSTSPGARKIIRITKPYDSKTKKTSSYPVTVTGVWPGEVYVLLTATEPPKGLKPPKQTRKRTLIKFTVTNKLYRGGPLEQITPAMLMSLTGSNATNVTITGSVTPPLPPVNKDADVEEITS